MSSLNKRQPVSFSLELFSSKPTGCHVEKVLLKKTSLCSAGSSQLFTENAKRWINGIAIIYVVQTMEKKSDLDFRFFLHFCFNIASFAPFLPCLLSFSYSPPLLSHSHD